MVGRIRFKATVGSLLIIMLVSIGLYPVAAAACALDFTASLSANGTLAKVTTGSPATTIPWAPFTFDKVLAPGTPVHISENHADLVKSLPKNVLTTPFHWDFGDGTVTPGFSAIHSYAHPGVFRVQVYAFYPKQHLWFVFDSARINIVAQTGVLQAVFTVASLEKLIALAAGIFLISLLVRQQRSRRYPPTIAG